MYGADIGGLQQAAAELRLVADELDAARGNLGGLLGALNWIGNVASSFVGLWNSDYKPRLGSTASFIRDAAAKLELQAQQQSDASTSVCGASLGLSFEPRTLEHFGDLGTGRNPIVEAFYAVTDGRRADFDEIEIRQLDNGRFIVVLPGVVDLSVNKGAVLDEVIDRGDVYRPFREGDKPDTARLMKYAIEEAHDRNGTYANPYAARVREALQAANVPEGSQVMLIGHSFGAYTAMELAGDDAFNAAGGAGTYRVTHVLAAGADVDWKLREVPAGTSALVLNNRYDLPFRLEDPLQNDFESRSPTHLEIEFQLGTKGAGHHPDNYVNWLKAATDRPELNRWLEHAGSMYSGSGWRYSAPVPDVVSGTDDVEAALDAYA